MLAPENTAVAFDLALAFGADVLETDVRLSRDDVVFATHDARLERTTDGYGPVRKWTSAKLARLNAGYRFVDPAGRAARAEGVRLLTLAALLERYPDALVNVDIKDASAAAADAVAAVLDRAGAARRVTVGSFHSPTIERFRSIAPDVQTAATRAEVARLFFGRFVPTHPRPDRLPYRWLQIPPSWYGIPLATPAFIAAAREHGVGSVYWTINDRTSMRKLHESGASGIVTDRPDIASELRASMSGDLGTIDGRSREPRPP